MIGPTGFPVHTAKGKAFPLDRYSCLVGAVASGESSGVCTALLQPQAQGDVPARLGEKPKVAMVQPQESLTAGSGDAHSARIPDASPARSVPELAGWDQSTGLPEVPGAKLGSGMAKPLGGFRPVSDLSSLTMPTLLP